ncbi:MAG: DUF2341 domain-containing protein [Methanocellales archaeon]|nr:DUF2341 domain-containing protein [Methanocellales archaeon]
MGISIRACPPIQTNIREGFKRLVTIDHTAAGASNLTDYQVKIALAYAHGLQEDFDDVRFAEEGGTKVSHWRETYTAKASATFWAKVASISANSKRYILLRFGHPTASSASDKNATFPSFEEDFSGDLSKWDTANAIGTWSIVSGELHCGGGTGAKIWTIDDYYLSPGTTTITYKTTDAGSGNAFGILFMLKNDDYYYWYRVSADGATPAGWYCFYRRAAGTTTELLINKGTGQTRTSPWYFKVQVTVNADSVVIDVWESSDGVNWSYHDDTNMPYKDTSAERLTQGKIGAVSSDGVAVDYDDYYIDGTRKYASPEPTTSVEVSTRIR